MNSGNHVGIALLIVGSLLFTSGSVLLVISLAKKPLALVSISKSYNPFLLLLGMTFVCLGMYSNRQYQLQREFVVKAIEQKDPFKLDKLLAANKQLAHADYSDLGKGEPLLHRAIGTGYYPMLLPLFSAHINLETRNASGDTALLLALRQQEFVMVVQLLDHAANTNAYDAKGISARELAQQAGPKFVELFSRFNAARESKTRNVPIVQNFEQTPAPKQLSRRSILP